MKATFLLEINTEGDSDLLGIASDLFSELSAHSAFDVLSVKPWKRAALGSVLPTQAGGPVPPPNVKPQ